MPLLLKWGSAKKIVVHGHVRLQADVRVLGLRQHVARSSIDAHEVAVQAVRRQDVASDEWIRSPRGIAAGS